MTLVLIRISSFGILFLKLISSIGLYIAPSITLYLWAPGWVMAIVSVPYVVTGRTQALKVLRPRLMRISLFLSMYANQPNADQKSFIRLHVFLDWFYLS